MDDTPVSRQRKWQLKKAEAGLCIQCGKPRGCDSKALCIDCRDKRRKYLRAARGLNAWKKGGRGRPPKD